MSLRNSHIIPSETARAKNAHCYRPNIGMTLGWTTTETREEVGERGRQRRLVGLRLERPKQPKNEQTKGKVSKSPRNLSVSWQSRDEGKDSELEFCIEKPSLGVENRHGKTLGRQRFLDLMVNMYRF